MTTQQVASRLVDLCRKGQISQDIQELYSNDIEPEHGPANQRRV